MSERKIRLTLSSTLHNGVGALIDVDFDSENLDVDVDVAAENGVSTLIKEYTVNATAGTYNLDISYKNDTAIDVNNDNIVDGDRNLIIEKIEFANDGISYQPFAVLPQNSNLNFHDVIKPMGYVRTLNPDFDSNLPRSDSNSKALLNPAFDENLPRTDNDDDDYIPGTHPGNNSKYLYDFIINPVTFYTAATATFYITFV
jgi:hypothetical protein